MMEKKYAYKTNYQKEKLKRIYIDIKKEIGEEFDKKLVENNLTRADVLAPTIMSFLENPKNFRKK